MMFILLNFLITFIKKFLTNNQILNYLLQLLEADHRLQPKYHPRLEELQIHYLAFCCPQGEVPDTGFWHTPR